MSYPIRRHTIKTNDALNRRKVNENYLQAAQSFDYLQDYSFIRRCFDRSKFLESAWNEYSWNGQEREPQSPAGFGFYADRVVPQSLTRMEVEEYGEYMLTYSVQLHGRSELIIVSPFIDGRILGQGSYAVEHAFPQDITGALAYDRVALDMVDGVGRLGNVPDDADLSATIARPETASGSAVITLDAGSFNVGLVWDRGYHTISSSAFPAGAANHYESITFNNCCLTLTKVVR